MKNDLFEVRCPYCSKKSPRLGGSEITDYQPGGFSIELETLFCRSCGRRFFRQCVEGFDDIVFPKEDLSVKKGLKATVVLINTPIPVELPTVYEEVSNYVNSLNEYTIVVSKKSDNIALKMPCNEHILISQVFEKTVQFSIISLEKMVKSIGFNLNYAKFVSTYPTVDKEFLALPYWRSNQPQMSWTDEDFKYLESKWNCQHKQPKLYVGVPEK